MNDTNAIKDRIDVVDFLSEYIQLKQAGANWKARCPFHNEKSPSFMASREKQIWHCFGCGEGGDIFSFLQKIEGVEFVEALTILAERAGVAIEVRGSSGPDKDTKTRLRDILKTSANFFHAILESSEASAQAREYLERRGVNKESIEKWMIGFIPEQSWSALTDFLTKKKGYGVEECVAAGVTRRSDKGRHFDGFRGRIMFPISDVHGSIVGFTGRLLEEKEGVGKYVNTPETVLFDKGRLVYGLHLAKQAAKQSGYFVVAEGQMDVIAAHQIGMKNVVAASGTALTTAQIQLLKRYTPQIRMAFDNDAAGERAAKRGIDLAVEAGLDVRVIVIPDGAGDDPDDCIQKNPEVWEKSVESAKPVFQYYIDRYVTGEVRRDPQKLGQVSTLLATELARVSDPVVADFWAQKISSSLGTSIESVKKKASQMRGGRRQQPTHEQQPVSVPIVQPVDRFTRLSQYALCIFATNESLLANHHVDPLVFVTDADRALYTFLRERYTNADAPEETQHREYLAIIELLATEKLFGFTDDKIEQELHTAVTELKKHQLGQQQKILMLEIERAESRGDHALAAELTQKYQDLN